jgi:hypothetical protein
MLFSFKRIAKLRCKNELYVNSKQNLRQRRLLKEISNLLFDYSNKPRETFFTVKFTKLLGINRVYRKFIGNEVSTNTIVLHLSRHLVSFYWHITTNF